MTLSMEWYKGDVMQLMIGILLCLGSTLGALLMTLTPVKQAVDGSSPSTWLACAKANPAKRAWEVFNLQYSLFWLACFAVIVFTGAYESFDELAYLVVCAGLCVPIVVFSLFWVQPSERGIPIGQRYAVKAMIWMGMFSFIGNYWYTHYFFCVLKASYLFPSWQLNDVPIPLYFATFFFFSTYHAATNLAIRKVVTSFRPETMRTVTLVFLVGVMSYTVAFMETLGISDFPYYTFEDRNMAYVIGSAFYGIYFIVSFPMFYAFEEWPQEKTSTNQKTSLSGIWSATVDSAGAGMLVLIMLDAVRLLVGEKLVIKGF